MFHSTTPGGYADTTSSSFHQHLQQPPVYVPSSRAVPSQYSSPSSHFQHQAVGASAWTHPDPSTYVGGGGHGLTPSGHPSALSAGQFYAQNVMMGSWRAYDSNGFQRASPYG